LVTDDSSPVPPGRQLSPYIPVGAEIGNYRIEAFLDRGGMASIYEATDLRLNRTVALKVLGHEVSDNNDFRERFMRESRVAASLDHPNIVPIYEAGEDEGLLYIAMRYVRGSNLAGLLRTNGALEPTHALDILAPVADALDTAHSAGLVHRDVKPANILLTSPPGHERHEHVYLTDFGLTKRTSALTKLTATGNFIGTMAYISPEQIRGQPLDARTDLYALGCVAYECLTGVPPFVRDDQAALLWAHLSEPPRALSSLKPDLVAADSVVAKALSKDPSDRFENCEEFIQSLSDALLTGRHSAVKLFGMALPTGDWRPPWAIAPSGEHESPDAPAPDDDHSAEQDGDDDPHVPPITHPSHAGSSPSEDRPPGSDRLAPSAPSPAHGSRPAAAAEHISQEPTDAPGSSDVPGPSEVPGPSGHPAAGASPMSARHRRRRRRTVVTVVAVALAVAAVIAAAVVVRPTTQSVAGSGRPASAPVSADATAATGDTSVTSPAATAQSHEHEPQPTTTAQAAPGPPGSSVVPDPSLAIPTFDGDPVSVGSTPGFVAVSPDGRLAYIARRDAGVVSVMDTSMNKVLADVPIPAGPPHFIAFSPDGSRAYVSVYNADLTINAVAVLDTRTTKVVGTIPVNKKPYALAVSPDQKFVYVPSHDSAVIDIIDIAANKVVQSVPVAPNPHWVTFDDDGTHVYIANHDSNVVSVLETASNTVAATIPVGTSPHSIAVSPDGTQVAVVCFTSNDVYFIDRETNQVLGTVGVGRNPQDLTYSPDGAYVYTANVDAGTVSVIDTETRNVTANVPTTSPTSVAILPNGRRAYVTNLFAGTLTVLKSGG
jgi:YVTN family beta-propeller protein